MSFQARKLGDLCDFQGGSQPPKSNFVYEPQDGYVRFLQIRDFGSEKNHTYIPVSKKNRICNSDDIMIGRYGASVGKILRGRSGAYNVALMKASPDTSVVDKQYFWHYLNSSIFQDDLKNVASRSAQDGFSKDDIFNFQVPLPPLATQQKIVAKLDAIFAEIDKATAAAEANAKNAEALYKSYLNQIFESRNKGWTEKKLPELCTLFNGRAYSKNELLDSGKYTVLRVGNFFTNEHWYYSDLELEENKYCENGDLLYAWSASFGPRIWNGEKVIYHYHIWKVVPNSALIDKMFLFYLLEWDVDKIKRDHGTGATMIHVSKKSMESRVLPYIDLKSQKEIVFRLEAIKKHTDNLKLQYDEKIIALVAYKNTILKQAFAGEFFKE